MFYTLVTTTVMTQDISTTPESLPFFKLELGEETASIRKKGIQDTVAPDGGLTPDSREGALPRG